MNVVIGREGLKNSPFEANYHLMISWQWVEMKQQSLLGGYNWKNKIL